MTSTPSDPPVVDEAARKLIEERGIDAAGAISTLHETGLVSLSSADTALVTAMGKVGFLDCLTEGNVEVLHAMHALAKRSFEEARRTSGGELSFAQQLELRTLGKFIKAVNAVFNPELVEEELSVERFISGGPSVTPAQLQPLMERLRGIQPVVAAWSEQLELEDGEKTLCRIIDLWAAGKGAKASDSDKANLLPQMSKTVRSIMQKARESEAFRTSPSFADDLRSLGTFCMQVDKVMPPDKHSYDRFL